MRELLFPRSILGSTLVRSTLVVLTTPFLASCFTNESSPARAKDVEVSHVALIRYDQSEAQVLIRGRLNIADAPDLAQVTLYLDSLCSGSSVGKGLVRDFSNNGVSARLPSTSKSSIFLKTNTNTNCYSVTEYEPKFSAPSPAAFTRAEPASPTYLSTQPVVFGVPSPFTSELRFFDDSLCSHPIGNGSASELVQKGIPIQVGSNQETVVYAQAVESFGRASHCAVFTRYIHRLSGAGLPSWISSSPQSPSGISTLPTIRGAGGLNSVRVQIFSDPGCSNLLSEGTTATFLDPGLSIAVTENSITPLYGISYDEFNVPTTCTYLTTFVHDSIAPGKPTFSTISPSSPTRLTIYPTITGTTPADAASISFFSDSNCTQQIGSATRAQYLGAGTTISVLNNQRTPIHAQSIDSAGNRSSCTFLTHYVHNTIPPDPPVYSAADPISPNNISSSPLISGSTGARSVTVNLFDNDICTHLVGSGTPDQFFSPGIQVTLPMNTISELFGQSVDLEGNISACTSLTSYAHSNLPAPDPSFIATNPPSPSRLSTRPLISGNAGPSVVYVKIFSDSSCTQEYGVGSRISFVTSGIPVNVPANTASSLYGQSIDIYGNSSSCVLLTTYTHNNVPPLNPVFVSVTPDTPNNQSYSPFLKGQAPQNPSSILPPTKITFYNDSFCLSPLAQGSVSAFTGAGSQLEVTPNTLVPIYAVVADDARNVSDCTHLVDYAYDDLIPGRPIFSSSLPATPSYTRDTVVRGTYGASPDFLPKTSIRLYSNSTCTAELTSVDPSLFTGAGIPITAFRNTVTSIYGATYNQVGTRSSCELLVNFLHNDLGPTGLTATSAANGTADINWNPDTVAFPFPKYTIKRSFKSGGPYSVVKEGNSGNYYRDESVAAGLTYYYVVSASNNTGRSLDSAEASFQVTISQSDPPTNLTVTPGAGRAYLSWSIPSTAVTTWLYRATQSGGPYTLIASNLRSSIYTDTTVNSDLKYYYVVQASNPFGRSIFSNEAAVIPRSAPASAPQNLRLQSPGCILLTWDPVPYYDYYNIKRGSSAGGETLYATSNTNSFSDCGPANGYNYYTVSGQWDISQTADSNEVGFYKWFNLSAGISGTPGDTSATLNWTDLGATSYRLERSTSYTGPFSTVATTAAESYTDSGITNGITYYYRVIPIYLTGDSFLLGPADVTPAPGPNAPGNLVIRANSLNNPQLYWSPPSHYNSFDVYRGTNVGGPFTFRGNTTSITYTDTTPLSGRSFYQVKAVWGTGASASSNTASFRNGYPASITATTNAANITISWSAVSGASNYTLESSTSPLEPFSVITTPTTTSTSFVNTGLSAGTGRYYRVFANFSDGTSGQYSSIVAGRAGTNTVPAGLSLTATTGTSISFQWTPINGATLYRVYRSLTSGGTYSLIGGTVSSTFSDVTLSSNTSYFYRVSAVVSSVESAQSSFLAGVTINSPTAPIGDPGNNRVDLSWSAATGGTFTILRSVDALNYSVLVSGHGSQAYTDSTAVNGTQYFYKITAVYPSISLTSLPSSGITPGLTPLIPQGLSVIDNNNGSIVLRWGAIQQATSYALYSSTTSGSFVNPPLLISTDPTWNSVSGLTIGTPYYFAVSSLIGTVESARSSQIVVIPENRPAAPVITVDPDATALLTVNWSSVAGATSYQLERSTDGANFSTIAPALTSTSYSDTSVTLGRAYWYRFLPRNGALDMAYSFNSASATPGFRPLPPSFLTAFGTATDTVSLQWIRSPNVASYEIFRATTSGGPYSLIGSVSDPVEKYIDTSASGGLDYYYVVRSINSLNIRSLNSNEATIRTGAKITDLAAVAGSNQISLDWSDLSGASSYTVKRGQTPNGPFGEIASSLLTSQYVDTALENGIDYYYVVNAVYSGGGLSANSNVATATGTSYMSIEFPIELLDRGISSSDEDPIVFERTRTSLNPSDYNGTVTYSLEMVAKNQDSNPYTVELVDGSGTPIGAIIVPANTGSPTRLVSTLNPNPGRDEYRLSLPQTNAQNDLQILSARIRVKQVNASKTKIYVPLLASSAPATSEDSLAPIFSTSSTDFSFSNFATLYQREVSQYADLPDFNSFELEAIAAAQGVSIGSIALYNKTQGDIVAVSESVFNSSNLSMATGQFGVTAPLFLSGNESDQYEVVARCQTRCGSGGIDLYKAGMWISLSRLKKISIPFRTTLGGAVSGSPVMVDSARTWIDLTSFSNPVAYFEAVGRALSGGTATAQLYTAGASDSAVAQSAIPGSSLNFTTSTKSMQRTASSISINSLDRFLTQFSSSGGDGEWVDSKIVIRSSQ